MSSSAVTNRDFDRLAQKKKGFNTGLIRRVNSLSFLHRTTVNMFLPYGLFVVDNKEPSSFLFHS